MIAASLIIPTYNRAESLRSCLEALAHQAQPASDYEVIVVVDGSTDTTLDMLKAFQAPFPLKVIQQSNHGQCAALNHGANAAQGRVLIFLDDDIFASPQLVVEHLKLHQDREEGVGIGKITLSLPEHADWYARVFAGEWEKHYHALDQGLKQPTWQDCFGGNMSVLRAAYLAVGGNAEDLQRAYDIDLAYRLMRSGCSFSYLAKAVGNQEQLKGFHELASDSAKSGLACVELSRRHPAMLPVLLGSFGEQRPAMATALQFLLAFNPSPTALERVFRLAGKRAERENNYHLFQRYMFWREVRKALPDRQSWRALIQGIPILMYHAFGAPGEPPSRYILPIRRFQRQMAWLRWNGYHILSLSDYLNLRSTHRLPPERSVILTIDDGYADNWALAFPVLRRYAFPATIFLVNQGVGGTNTWAQNSELFGRAMLSWENIREMHQAGIEFGAHTCTHPNLTAITPDHALEEMEGSRAGLEQGLSTAVSAFAYPYGKHNREIRVLADQAGFLGSVSTDPGKNTLVTPLQALRRVEIRGTDSLLQFALSVRYGMDPQTLQRQFSNKSIFGEKS